MECDFTYKHYEYIIKEAKRRGYQIRRLMDYRKSFTKAIYLRHDVDFDVDCALRLARLEKKLKVKSTYFFRLHAKNYNLFSDETILRVKEMQKMGHEIGLHYSSSFNNLKTEKEIFEKGLGIKINGFSIHEPSRTGLNIKNNTILYNAYDDKFFKKMKYLSDSGGRWREGCVCNHFDKNQICLLTHAIWWYNKSPVENY